MKHCKLTKFILAAVVLAVLAMPCLSRAQNFEPKYVSGYPTEETAKAAFDEYDYQAAG